MIYVKLFATAVFWGGTFIAGRVIVRQVDPFSAAFLRFAVAAFFLLMFCRYREGRFPVAKRRQILPLFFLSATGILFYNMFFFMGLKHIEAGRAAIVVANNPICIALLSAYFFKDRLTPQKITGIVLSVSGALIVILRGDLAGIFQGGFGRGEFYIFLCVISWSAFSLIGKSVLKGLSPLVSVTYASLFGLLLLLPLAAMEGVFHHIRGYTSTEWLGIFYLGFFGTVLGFVWYYEGIQRIGPTKASIFINFVPISAIVLAFFILGEQLTLSLLSGTILVSFGVYLTNTAGSRL